MSKPNAPLYEPHQKKVCENCGALYWRKAYVHLQKWTQRRFCSRRCGTVYAQDRKPLYAGNCTHCGNVITPDKGRKSVDPKQKFCSQRCNGLHRQRSWRVRFWESVAVGSENDCWIWTGHTNERGYGVLNSHGEDKAETALASRLSWILATGSGPGKLFVCHRCDNPGCVNPKHLFLGTHQDNMDDMIAKNRGRWARGEDGGHSKLKEDDVRLIRQERARGVTYADLARRLLVHEQTVKNACIGKTWRHVA